MLLCSAFRAWSKKEMNHILVYIFIICLGICSATFVRTIRRLHESITDVSMRLSKLEVMIKHEED